jgi:hypothetical protein
MTELTTVSQIPLPTVARYEQWFASEEDVPANLTEQEWLGFVQIACQSHRHLLWRVAALLCYGERKFGETYYTLAEWSGYSPGFLRKLGSLGNRGVVETRRSLCEADPSVADVPLSWWEAVAPIKDEDDRQMLVMKGWDSDGQGARLETEAFKAMVTNFRELTGQSKTDRKQRQQSEPEPEPSEIWQEPVYIGAACAAQVELLGRYYKLTDTSAIVEQAIDQLCTIKKTRLQRVEAMHG